MYNFFQNKVMTRYFRCSLTSLNGILKTSFKKSSFKSNGMNCFCFVLKTLYSFFSQFLENGEFLLNLLGFPTFFERTSTIIELRLGESQGISVSYLKIGRNHELGEDQAFETFFIQKWSSRF